jgi:hypothetical protein
MNCETNKIINLIYKPILQYGKKEEHYTERIRRYSW